MVELSCPNCGRTGAVPREKQHSRLVCKKCHRVFHLNDSGRVVLGEPPADLHQKTTSRHKDAHEGPHLPSLKELGELKSGLSDYELPVKPIGIGLAVLVVGWLVMTILSAPPESLNDAATKTTTAFANDDLSHLKSIAADDTVDDVVRWYDQVHAQFDVLKKKWETKDRSVRVLVIDEDRRNRRGQTEAFVYPTESGSKTESLADAGGAAQPMELHLHWILDGRGKWRLDGRSTLQAATRVAAN